MAEKKTTAKKSSASAKSSTKAAAPKSATKKSISVSAGAIATSSGSIMKLGSREAAYQALLLDPVVGSSRAADGILADFESAHGDLWPALS